MITLCDTHRGWALPLSDCPVCKFADMQAKLDKEREQRSHARELLEAVTGNEPIGDRAAVTLTGPFARELLKVLSE